MPVCVFNVFFFLVTLIHFFCLVLWIYYSMLLKNTQHTSITNIHAYVIWPLINCSCFFFSVLNFLFLNNWRLSVYIDGKNDKVVNVQTSRYLNVIFLYISHVVLSKMISPDTAWSCHPKFESIHIIFHFMFSSFSFFIYLLHDFNYYY